MKDENTKLSRRNFLAAIGASSAAGAAALAATAAQATPVTAQVVEDARREIADQGVSEHMRNYYRTTRI
jgi:mevalonate pyrophosphate decarboxylase